MEYLINLIVTVGHFIGLFYNQEGFQVCARICNDGIYVIGYILVDLELNKDI